MTHPTDPMTPVRALIEAAGRAKKISHVGGAAARQMKLGADAMKAHASISQLLSEHDKVVALGKELLALADEPGAEGDSAEYTEGLDYALRWCASRMQSIVEGK